jgi:ribonuclease VapC
LGSDRLQDNSENLMMSTVNYAEALILVADRSPAAAVHVREAVESSSIRLVSPSVQHAEIAAIARGRYPLNLGDCFAYALAKGEDCPVLTLDRDFRRTDVAAVLPRK